MTCRSTCHALLLLLLTCTLQAATPLALHPAIHTDPPVVDGIAPRMAVLHVPSGDVEINGVAYLAGGKGPRPTLVICHGLPGNEKNLDLAHAVRRAGWNTVTFNYRGSWGSPGRYAFLQNPEDARAVLAYLRRSDVATALGIDTRRIVLAGHSMGGWVTAMVASTDAHLAGAILISAGNLAYRARAEQAPLVAMMKDNMESLAGVTADSLAEQLRRNPGDYDFLPGAAALSRLPLLVLSSDDGFAPQTDELVSAVQAAGGTLVTRRHVPTDHGWSDRRVLLAHEILTWLDALPPR